MGTADDPVTARDAYAGLSSAAESHGYTIVDRHRVSTGELGADVRARVLVGTYTLAEARSGPNARIAEVVATRGRTVLTVHYVGAIVGPDQESIAIEPAKAERAALKLAKALLVRT